MNSDLPAAVPAPARRTSRWALALGALGALGVAAGAALLLTAGQGSVEQIRVSRYGMLPESMMGTPDYYIVVGLAAGEPLTADAYEDTPIGNGLDFKLSRVLQLEEVAHVELFDQDVGSDDVRDRVDIRGRISKGQDYQFELIGPASPQLAPAYAALSAGGAALVLAAIVAIRSYAL